MTLSFPQPPFVPQVAWPGDSRYFEKYPEEFPDTEVCSVDLQPGKSNAWI